MAKLTIYDQKGKQVGTYEIDPAELAPRINKQLLHDVVVMYQANQRQGTMRTKTRSEVAGTTKKLYGQKGTGNARAGSRRSGIRRGGGHIFAKRPRDWSYRLPRKAVQAATRMAVASKIQDEEIVVIDELKFTEPKTREMAEILGVLGCSNMSVMLATSGYDMNVYKSARNIRQVSVANVANLNACDVLSARRLLVTRATLDYIKNRAAGRSQKADSKKRGGLE